MTLKRKLLIIFLSIVVILLLLINYIVPRMIVEINNTISTTLKPLNKNIPKPIDYNLNYSEINIITNDKLKLAGYVITTNAVTQRGTIIFVHGVRAYKEHFLPVCKMLSDSGYNSVLIDLRAHGESQGKYCTFGYYEKQDLRILLDSISKIKNLNTNYGIWGQSLGGAVALQTLAIDKRLKFGIIESTFSDLNTIIHDYFKLKLGFDIPFISNYFIWRAEKIANFKVSEVAPCQSAKLIKQPVFMAHGSVDDRINITYGKENYKNLASKNKIFYECKNANHINVWEVGGNAYFEKVFEFLNKNN